MPVEGRRLEFDEPLPPLAELVGALFDDIAEVDASDDAAHVASVVVDMPFELEVELDEPSTALRDDERELTVRCSPPTQYTETSVMPVFHRLRLRLERSSPPEVSAPSEGLDAG